jgi:hypothetical protein
MRGRIFNQRHVEYDSWAECGGCGRVSDNLPSPARGRTAASLRASGALSQVDVLKREGWKRTANGWTCPDCLARKKN